MAAKDTRGKDPQKREALRVSKEISSLCRGCRDVSEVLGVNFFSIFRLVTYLGLKQVDKIWPYLTFFLLRIFIYEYFVVGLGDES